MKGLPRLLCCSLCQVFEPLPTRGLYVVGEALWLLRFASFVDGHRGTANIASNVHTAHRPCKSCCSCSICAPDLQ